MYKTGTYVIFVILLTPTPFSADTKNTDFSTRKNTKFKIFTPKHTYSHFFDTRLNLTPASGMDGYGYLEKYTWKAKSESCWP